VRGVRGTKEAGDLLSAWPYGPNPWAAAATRDARAALASFSDDSRPIARTRLTPCFHVGVEGTFALGRDADQLLLLSCVRRKHEARAAVIERLRERDPLAREEAGTRGRDVVRVDRSRDRRPAGVGDFASASRTRTAPSARMSSMNPRSAKPTYWSMEYVGTFSGISPPSGRQGLLGRGGGGGCRRDPRRPRGGDPKGTVDRITIRWSIL
jgi:hypothetical protein